MAEDFSPTSRDTIATTEPATSASTSEDGVFLSWAGRKRFRAAVPTPRVFVPVPEASDPTEENPGNLVIEGDNRQAMVSLFAQYPSQVDVVVIDPPYNTGKNDFRYDDARFQDPDADHSSGGGRRHGHGCLGRSRLRGEFDAR